MFDFWKSKKKNPSHISYKYPYDTVSIDKPVVRNIIKTSFNHSANWLMNGFSWLGKYLLHLNKLVSLRLIIDSYRRLECELSNKGAVWLFAVIWC